MGPQAEASLATVPGDLQGVRCMAVGIIGAPDQCVSSPLEDPSEHGSEGERQGKDGVLQPFPERKSAATQMWAKPEACPSGWNSRTSAWACFTETLEVCFSPLSVQCAGGGSRPGTVWVWQSRARERKPLQGLLAPWNEAAAGEHVGSVRPLSSGKVYSPAKAHWPPKPAVERCPLAAAAKTQAPAPLHEARSGAKQRETRNRHPWVCGPGGQPSRFPRVCPIGSLPLSLTLWDKQRSFSRTKWGTLLPPLPLGQVSWSLPAL